MSTKTINERIKCAAIDSDNCHCTNGVSKGPTMVQRVAKIDGSLKAEIVWSVTDANTKVIMTTPIGSVNIFYINNNITDAELNAKFLEIFKTQHNHWGTE